MKKIALILLLSSALLLTACSNNNDGNTADSSSKVETKVSNDKAKTENVSFKDGVLETKDYKLKIKNTETIQSPSVDNPGLYVTFELTNKSEDTLTPFKVLYDIGFKQKTETSLVKMSAGYQSFDAFGDDANSMNRITERQNALSNELLPEKTVEIYEAYSLDNTTDEVQVLPDIDGINSKDYDAYVIKPTAFSTETSGSQSENEGIVQEEDYEALKKRTLQSSPTDRVTWGNKEWETLGVALSENGLAMDDNGYIITQAQKDQIEAERQKSEQQTEFEGGHGAPKVVTSEAQAVQIAQSQFGDNSGSWIWGCLYEDERGYFVKATDPNDGTMTHTAKSVFVHYDGSITEN